MRRGVAHGDHVLQFGLDCGGSLHLTLVIGRGVALVCVEVLKGEGGCCTILKSHCTISSVDVADITLVFLSC